MTRTFSRTEWAEAEQAWRDLMPRPSQLALWEGIRRAARERGILYPPTGSRWDSWADPQPSQFALIARESVDNPGRLLAAIGASGSWSQVIARIVRQRDDIREDTLLREKDDRWERAKEPTHREAAMSVGAILQRLADSAGVER